MSLCFLTDNLIICGLIFIGVYTGDPVPLYVSVDLCASTIWPYFVALWVMLGMSPERSINEGVTQYYKNQAHLGLWFAEQSV